MTTPRSHRWRSRTPQSQTTTAAARPRIDPVKVGRASVRRRGAGLSHAEILIALEDARIDRHLDRRHEESADDDGRGAAVLAEWERIEQLLAGTTDVYTPDADPLVQEELAIEQRRQEAEQAEHEAQQLIADRADELAQQLSSPHTTMVSQAGDEAARDLLALRRDWRVEKVDAWLAQALADHSGHYTDPAARTAAAATLPAPVRAHASLLSALAHIGRPADVGDLPFLGRLAEADAAATTALAQWLNRPPGTTSTTLEDGTT